MKEKQYSDLYYTDKKAETFKIEEDNLETFNEDGSPVDWDKEGSAEFVKYEKRRMILNNLLSNKIIEEEQFQRLKVMARMEYEKI